MSEEHTNSNSSSSSATGSGLSSHSRRSSSLFPDQHHQRPPPTNTDSAGGTSISDSGEEHGTTPDDDPIDLNSPLTNINTFSEEEEMSSHTGTGIISRPSRTTTTTRTATWSSTAVSSSRRSAADDARTSVGSRSIAVVDGEDQNQQSEAFSAEHTSGIFEAGRSQQDVAVVDPHGHGLLREHEHRDSTAAIEDRENIAESVQSVASPVFRHLPPPAPPLIAELPRQEPGDDGTTFIDGLAEFGEPQSRAAYKRRAILGIIFGAASACLGALLISVRHEGGPSACCLPTRCNVMKLPSSWDGKNMDTSRICNFTESEWEVMGCLAQHQAVSANCTMSKPPVGEDGSPTAVDPCVQNLAIEYMMVTGLMATIAGGLCIVGGFFCLCAFDCFGGIYQKSSTRHWIARVFALLLWLGILGCCCAGITFAYFASTMTPTVREKASCVTAREENSTECPSDRSGGLFWEGDYCPIAQQAANVFNWPDATTSQLWFIGSCNGCFWGFVIYTIVCVVVFGCSTHKRRAARDNRKEKERRLAQIQLADLNDVDNPMLAQSARLALPTTGVPFSNILQQPSHSGLAVPQARMAEVPPNWIPEEPGGDGHHHHPGSPAVGCPNAKQDPLTQ